MTGRARYPLPEEPPSAVMRTFRNRLSGQELRALEAVFTLRTTVQQADNAVTEWIAATAGSPARYQILMLLWAAEGRSVRHKEIVEALGVTRATVSGLMTGLERDGLVRSTAGCEDRRSQFAALTCKGKAIVGTATEANRNRLRAAFASLSSEQLTTFTVLLRNVRQGFAEALQPGLGVMGQPVNARLQSARGRNH